jgi:hypothetical protein
MPGGTINSDILTNQQLDKGSSDFQHWYLYLLLKPSRYGRNIDNGGNNAQCLTFALKEYELLHLRQRKWSFDRVTGIANLLSVYLNHYSKIGYSQSSGEIRRESRPDSSPSRIPLFLLQPVC